MARVRLDAGRERRQHQGVTIRRSLAYLAVVLALLAGWFAAHRPSLDAFFLADDFYLIQELASNMPGVWPSDDRFFRPLTSLSLQLDVSLFGLRASW